MHVYKWVISTWLCPLQLASKPELCVQESVFHLTADIHCLCFLGWGTYPSKHFLSWDWLVDHSEICEVTFTAHSPRQREGKLWPFFWNPKKAPSCNIPAHLLVQHSCCGEMKTLQVDVFSGTSIHSLINSYLMFGIWFLAACLLITWEG